MASVTIFLGRGRRRPRPKSPRSRGDQKKTQTTVSVPIENCLTEGVQSMRVCPILCPIVLDSCLF